MGFSKAWENAKPVKAQDLPKAKKLKPNSRKSTDFNFNSKKDGDK